MANLTMGAGYPLLTEWALRVPPFSCNSFHPKHLDRADAVTPGCLQRRGTAVGTPVAMLFYPW